MTGAALDWDRLRVFHAVAEAGSFTRAGDALNRSQSAISRQISQLEDDLRLKLFRRHSRGLMLTEPGEVLFRTTHDMQAKLAMAEARLSERKEKPTGPLIITATVGFGSVWLTPRIREFVETYPDVTVTLIVDDHELDLSMREADVAIRLGPSRQPDLIQRPLMTVRQFMYASPAYIRRHGAPRATGELDRHQLITYGEGVLSGLGNMNWLLDIGTSKHGVRRPVLQINNVVGMIRAVESGLGIAALPDYIVHDSSNVVPVLPDVIGPSFDVFFVYPEELRNSKRTQVFRDFLFRKVREAGL